MRSLKFWTEGHWQPHVDRPSDFQFCARQIFAGVIRISPDGRDLDLDLVEIRLAPLSVKYIATISHSSLVWTEKEIRWNELQVAAPSTTEREILSNRRRCTGIFVWRSRANRTEFSTKYLG